jgi:hypothetical protein
MTVPPISPQWLRKGKFEVKALSPSVMWQPTFGVATDSMGYSGEEGNRRTAPYVMVSARRNAQQTTVSIGFAAPKR